MSKLRRLMLAAIVFWGASPALADPPPANPFPVPAPRVFCFRVTDIEQDSGDPDRFQLQFEFLNWTDRPAHGAYVWVNDGTSAVLGGPPQFATAAVDPDGRGGPPGGAEIGLGNFGIPAHHSGRGRGDIPGHLNDWTVVFQGPTSVFWGGDGTGSLTAIPQRNLMDAGSSAAQYSLVPGLGFDGLPTDDSAVDGGPGPYGPPTQPAPFAAGGQPNPDGSGNVLDGFVVDIEDFDEGEILSINWMLTDASGSSIGKVGTSGTTVGNEMGFGVFNVIRVAPGAAASSSRSSRPSTVALPVTKRTG